MLSGQKRIVVPVVIFDLYLRFLVSDVYAGAQQQRGCGHY
jgi:hypothetical protein